MRFKKIKNGYRCMSCHEFKCNKFLSVCKDCKESMLPNCEGCGKKATTYSDGKGMLLCAKCMNLLKK